MPAGGGTSQTAVNRKAGARTQLASLVTAAVSLATLLVLAPLIGLMPQAALAAVVVAYSFDLIQPGEFAAIRRVRRIEFRWAVIAFVGVVLLGTLQGILVAVDRLAAGARAAGLRSAGPRRRPQARHRCVPSALERSSRR